MPTEKKIQQVEELEDHLERSLITISLDYRGLSVSQMHQLRRVLREIEPTNEMKVIKNSMLRRAADNAGKSGLMEVVHEATALVFGYEDEVTAAKGLHKFATDNRLELTIRGGFMDGAVLTTSDIAQLATTPGRLELMAKLAGGLNGPATGIAGGINALLRELAAIVEARAAQLESEGGAEASEAAPPDAADDEADEESPTDEAEPSDEAEASDDDEGGEKTTAEARTEAEPEAESEPDTDAKADAADAGDDSE